MSRGAPARCPYCKGKGRIRNSEELSLLVRDVYIDCTNHKCGHRWKAKLEFEHSIAVPANEPRPRDGIPTMPSLKKLLGLPAPPHCTSEA